MLSVGEIENLSAVAPARDLVKRRLAAEVGCQSRRFHGSLGELITCCLRVDVKGKSRGLSNAEREKSGKLEGRSVLRIRLFLLGVDRVS